MSYESGAFIPRYDHLFYAGDLVCLAALNLYRQESGDNHGRYGNQGAVGPFADPTAQTVPAMIGEMTAFWTTAQADFDSGTSFKGLSSAKPREYFDSWPVDKGADFLSAGLGSWQFGFSTTDGYAISGLGYATALWAFSEVYGPTHEIIADVWPWLMTFTTFAGSARLPDESDDELTHDERGSYDPSLALGRLLLVQSLAGAPLTTNYGVQYELATVGLLAQIQASYTSGALDRAKKTFSNVRERGVSSGKPESLVFDDLRLQGYCGLGLQVFDAVVTPELAAQFGLAYRYGTPFPTPVRP